MTVVGYNSNVKLLDDGKTVRITSPAQTEGEGVDISRHCRAATINLSVDSVNSATLEVVGPAVDVLAKLKDVRVVYVCSECKKEVE